MLSYHPFPLLFPEPGTGPVIAWYVLLPASGAITQQYDTQPLKVEAVMRPFGCTIANTKEEDVLIYICVYIYNMTVLLFKTHIEIK